MDFWAQHKDFVLKVLAGFAVFLVALIARGVVYGDDLEQGQAKNGKMAREVRGMKIADVRAIKELEKDTKRLDDNAKKIIGQIGHLGTAEQIELELIDRVLGYLRRYRNDPGQRAREARRKRGEIVASPPSGFGTLRGLVNDELGEEASEKNIRIEAGFGFQAVTEIDRSQIEKYLLQLELVARVMRYCIDQGSNVKAIEEVRIETKGQVAVLGANREFIREYPVRIRFKSTLAAAVEVLRRLNDESPSVGLRSMRIDRTKRPRDHVVVEIVVLATAAALDKKVPFDAPKKGTAQ